MNSIIDSKSVSPQGKSHVTNDDVNKSPMRKSIIVLLATTLFLSSCKQENKLDCRDYDKTITYINNYTSDSPKCNDIYEHNIKLSFSFIDFSAESMEIVVLSKYKILYRGYKTSDVSSDTLYSCRDRFLSDLEVFYVILLDHENKKAYQFHEKESHISSELQSERFLLFSDGTYRLVHDNWLLDLLF
ncbi:MAG: hypothetical protein J6Y72_05340 [Bacteroidales bacterium]|nr:hypothetical protein [Bacteroidales bacterium]